MLGVEGPVQSYVNTLPHPNRPSAIRPKFHQFHYALGPCACLTLSLTTNEHRFGVLTSRYDGLDILLSTPTSSTR